MPIVNEESSENVDVRHLDLVAFLLSCARVFGGGISEESGKRCGGIEMERGRG